MQPFVANPAYMAASALLQLKDIAGRDDLISVIQLHINDLQSRCKEQDAKIESLEAELSKAYEIATRQKAKSLWARMVRWFQGPKGY